MGRGRSKRRDYPGTGEVIDRPRDLVASRWLFLEALQNEVPEACSELWSDEAVRLEQEFHDWFEDAVTPARDNPAYVHEVGQRPPPPAGIREFVLGWTRRYLLHDSWCYLFAQSTITWVTALEVAGLRSGRTPQLVLRDVDWVSFALQDVVEPEWRLPDHMAQVDRSLIYVTDLLMPAEDEGYGARTDDGQIDRFDPKEERIDDAVMRIMPMIEQRLRAALARRVDEMTAGKVVPVEPLPPTEHFSWLVRYQVRGESFERLAKSVGKERSVVSQAVKQAAARIGLTLREPSQGGRPRKSTARTMRHRQRPSARTD